VSPDKGGIKKPLTTVTPGKLSDWFQTLNWLTHKLQTKKNRAVTCPVELIASMTRAVA